MSRVLTVTLTRWWNTPQYVRDELNDTIDEFQATLDVSDVTKDRVIPAWRWKALGVVMLAVWAVPFLLLLAISWAVATANGVCKSVFPFLLHHTRRGIAMLAVAGCPTMLKPERKPFEMPPSWMDNTSDTPEKP